MIERNRKAVIAYNGRSIVVFGRDGEDWRLCPASWCEWEARNRTKKDRIGFGHTIWSAIRSAKTQ